MSETLAPIVYQLGLGGTSGFVVGYAIKKMVKLVAVIAGIFFLILMYLGNTGVIKKQILKSEEDISKILAEQWKQQLPFVSTGMEKLGIEAPQNPLWANILSSILGPIDDKFKEQAIKIAEKHLPIEGETDAETGTS